MLVRRLPGIFSWGPSLLGAFLLFSVQPLFAKWLLPVFGGNPVIWSLCMVCFQSLLLVGYALSHLCTTLLQERVHAKVQLVSVCLAATLLVIQGVPELGVNAGAKSVSEVDSFGILLGRIGLPYILLASTTPVLSRFLSLEGAGAVGAMSASRSTGRPETVHRLYAVSNAGALFGLLLYPFAAEPIFDIGTQFALWSKAFILYCFMMAGASWVTLRQPQRAPQRGDQEPERTAVRPERKVFWLGCSLVPSMMLLAATNHISVDIAATPLLWVVPLALYLLSFILAFSSWNAAWRGPTLLLWMVGALGLSLNTFQQGAASVSAQVGATLAAMFASCLLCHGELANSRPASAGLSRFYLVIAAGGALGGAFVGLVAPFVLSDFFELEIATAATFAMLFIATQNRDNFSWPRGQMRLLWLSSGLCIPLLFGGLLVRAQVQTRQGEVVERRRGLLGPLRVVDTSEARLLIHGRIQHGSQLLAPELRRTPTMYFGQGSALARVLGAVFRPSLNIGVLGLGVGTIAAYGRAGDSLRFYELDQNVIDISRTRFTFLEDSPAKIEVFLGDGRLLLARQRPQHFDVLVLDAFSSDAVPVHLLTREAFVVYLQQLAPDGVLLANVSNRHLAVHRVVEANARAFGLAYALFSSPSDAALHVAHVQWAVMARDPERLVSLFGKAEMQTRVPGAPDSRALWTDTRASVLSILRN